jgi:predicted regulator of Ras-like GTPase activity (Roadblock/LC7/MglB family)
MPVPEPAPESPAERVRRLSEELARDPASRAFLALGEALRRQGELDVALRVAHRGLERHPHDADAHDLLARICADRGEWERASEEWERALRLTPTHRGAIKGTGLVHFRNGRLAEAERALRAVAGDDPGAAAALAHVRAELAAPSARVHAPAPSAVARGDARTLFDDTLAAPTDAALLLDGDGLVIAGRYHDQAGRDAGDDVGAQLTGVGEEATRAMRHLGLGAWRSLSLEAEGGVVTLAPAPQGALLLVAASAAAPLGYVHRLVARTMARAERWLEGGA